MKMKHALALLTFSAFMSGWLYWNSTSELEQVLTSKEWQSNLVGVVAENEHSDSNIGPLSRLELFSNVRYLPNGDYIRESTLRLFGQEADKQTVYKVSEKGEWQMSDNYLLLSPREFQDAASAQSNEFTPSQLTLIKQFLRLEAQQSRRVDVVDEKTLLLTSLNQGSSVLFSN
ncbi:regulatory protein ToxS [Vibrio hippocampi]|uniref:Transmembrane regulatory protein ToxS n=1 Tax=Vibrio hippocampi TaxID=654686 RepID=A0ABM8ZJA0_9VIBR|nr:regulatory protein ToxS [Vibrio hippocampi]CAH0526756.1 Transmembrane regulatory protein ToxS [Vibrio hippocampi]